MGPLSLGPGATYLVVPPVNSSAARSALWMASPFRDCCVRPTIVHLCLNKFNYMSSCILR